MLYSCSVLGTIPGLYSLGFFLCDFGGGRRIICHMKMKTLIETK